MMSPRATRPDVKPQPQLDLFISEYSEGGSNNKYLEIYNPTDAAISLSGYYFGTTSNDPDPPGEWAQTLVIPAKHLKLGMRRRTRSLPSSTDLALCLR